MTSRTKKDRDDLQKIKSELASLNGIREKTINLQLDANIIALKDFILEKQIKLEKEIKKLQDMTTDNIACGLLDSITLQLHKIGDEYSAILDLENQQINSNLEQMGLMTRIIRMLQQIVNELQEIEDFLNIDI